MANSNLKTLSEIFNDKIFRIPDYQRGYSWGETQLEDLWRDIDNLPLDKSHYTGMITVDIKDDIHYVIDGQQRLTTLIIFLKNILDKYDQDKSVDDLKKSEAIEKYLYSKKKGGIYPEIIFGYLENNSSYDFYKTKILHIKDKTSDNYEKTLYTGNLEATNSYFKQRLANIEQKDLLKLFKKITEQLKFILFEITKDDIDIDEHIIFETMNYRGKELSTLELLKNRLIYITTMLDCGKKDKEKIKEHINKVWKTIFKFLGKDRKMDDEFFLATHMLMLYGEHRQSTKKFLLNDKFSIRSIQEYNRYAQKSSNQYLKELKEIYKTLDNEADNNIANHDETVVKYTKIWDFLNILESKFIKLDVLDINGFKTKNNPIKEEFQKEYSRIVKNTAEGLDDFYNTTCCLEENVEYAIEEIPKLAAENYTYYNMIEDYATTISDSIKSYFHILNPDKNDFSDEVNKWLSKLNILGCDEFMHVLFPIFNKYHKKNDTDIIEILKYIENYLFVSRFCSLKNTRLQKHDFYTLGEYYNENNNLTMLKSSLFELIYNKKNKIEKFKSTSFILKINELFEEKKEEYGNGYYDWSGLKYVLYEYELHLQAKKAKKVYWDDVNKESIEHIYPQTPKDKTWIDDFSKLTTVKQKNRYRHSLGNLLLLSKRDNSKVSNKPFKDKKEIFSSGSSSEIEVSKYEKWTTKEIDERSEKILNFMNDRWHLGLKIADINKLK